MASELKIYQGHLESARSTVLTVYNALKVVDTTLSVVSGALFVLKQIDTNADRLEKVATGLQTVLKLVGKIGPLKGLTKPLGELLEAVENRAREVEASAEKLDSKFKPLSDAISIQKAIIGLQLVTLSESLDQIYSIKAGIDDAVDAVELTPLPTQASAAVANANAVVKPVNDTAATITNAINVAENAAAAVANALSGILSPAKAVIAIFNTIQDIVGSLDFLSGPLKAVQAVVRPIEWALDAIDFVFNAVVSPILDPILDALGVKKLIQGILDSINLPTIAPFAALETELQKLSDAIATLFDPLGDAIDDLADNTLGNLILGALNQPPDANGNLVIGDDDNTDDNPGTLLDALAGDDLVAGGLGDDTLRGNAGNDVLIGGVGDDSIDGGAGYDSVVLLAPLTEFSFSLADNGATLIATHANRTPAFRLQGTDRITGVEKEVFLDRAVDFADFQNFFIADTVPDTVDGTANNDFIFGGAGADLLRGLGGNDYLEGKGETDTLQGGAGNDWLDGGPGNDTFDGGAGIDTATLASSGNSINYASLNTDAARTPFVNVETFIAVENLVGSTKTDWLWGSSAANLLLGDASGDRINGFAGNDTLEGGKGGDQLVGGDGNDVSRGGDDIDIIVGGRGNDSVDGGGQHDAVWYGGGAAAHLG